MMLPRRAHDWAADHFRFVQYPRQRYIPRGESDRLGKALRWGAFGWLMLLIWGPAVALVFCVTVALVY